MKSHVKIAGLLLAAALAGSPRLPAAAAPATNAPATNAAISKTQMDDLFPDPVIAKGTGFEIKRSQLDEAVNGIKARAAASRQQIPPEQLPLVEKNSLDRLLQIELLKAKATDADKAAGKEEADKRFGIIKKRAASEEMLVSQLKAMNLTIPELKKKLVEEATAEKVLLDKVKVSEADIKKFYDENPSKFEEPEMVRASHILISTLDPTGQPMTDEQKKAKRKIIEDILVQARKPDADFAKLAMQYSEDPGSKNKGGEYTFKRGDMVPEFEAAAFNLKTNQISDVVTTHFGYHIIKLSEKIPAKKISFAEAKPDIKSFLEAQQAQTVLPELYAQLKKEMNVQILDERLKKLEDSDLGVPMAAGASVTNLPKPAVK